MKKSTYMFAALIMVAVLGSCEQETSEIQLKKSDNDLISAINSSDGGITPVIIPGANNGGNVTCADVAEEFDLSPGYFLCGEKLDFNNGIFDGEFPDGLSVNVTDGIYVAFEMESPLMINGMEYIVGAVIVKGSNVANVYFYPGGSMGDSDLSAPVNSSGKPAGLSNLTFCLVKANPLIIALKTYLANPVEGEVVTYVRNGWAVSSGLDVSTEYGLHMGYNYYDFNGENEFDLVRATLDAIVGSIGTIKARDYWESDIHYLEVVLDLTDDSFVFDDTYLYVGSLEGYQGRWYKLFPFYSLDNFEVQRVFKIDFATIIL